MGSGDHLLLPKAMLWYTILMLAPPLIDLMSQDKFQQDVKPKGGITAIKSQKREPRALLNNYHQNNSQQF